MSEVLRPGQVLYGYCGGHFGRDSYDDKRVEAIGADWVVVREENGQPGFYSGDPEALLEYTQPECGGCGMRPRQSPCPRCGEGR